MDSTQTEPAKKTGAQNAVIGFVVAVVGLLAALGLDVSQAVQHAIIVVIVAFFVLWPYLTALKIRGQVFSPATVKALVSQAHAAGRANQDPPKV